MQCSILLTSGSSVLLNLNDIKAKSNRSTASCRRAQSDEDHDLRYSPRLEHDTTATIAALRFI